MLGSIALRFCPLCGAAGGLWLFFLLFGVFLLMFAGTILLFIAAWGRGEWRDQNLRFAALEAEGVGARRATAPSADTGDDAK